MAKVEAARGAGRDRPRRRRQRRRVPGRRARARRDRRAGVRAPVRRPGDRRRPGLARARAARGRAGPGEGRRSRSAAAGCAPASRWRSRPPGRTCRSSASRPRRARRSRSRCRPASRSRPQTALTIADGIAVKRPGGITLAAAARELTDEVVVVGEDETAEAMALLLERCKLVVEGAGAVGVAALLGGQVKPARARRRPSRSSPAATSTPACWPRSPAGTRPSPGAGWSCSPASPTGPARSRRILATVAGTGANIVDVSHMREGLDLHVRETAVEIVLETRGARARAAGARHAARRGVRGAGPALINATPPRGGSAGSSANVPAPTG